MSDLDPPAHLSPAARTLWTQTVQAILEAGTITRLDPNSLTAYVSAVRSHQRATQILDRTDIMIERGGTPAHGQPGEPGYRPATPGKLAPNPALAIQRETAQVIATFARQFRLNAGQPPGQPADQPGQPTPMQEPQPMRPGRWCEEHGRMECSGNRSRGRGICHGSVMAGLSTCRMHPGSNAALKHLAAKLEREPTYGVPVQMTAEQVLVNRLWTRAGHVKWLGDRVGELEAAALTWGTDRIVEKWWGEFPGSETVRKAGPHVLLDLYDRESRGLEALAAKIVELGLASRLVTAAQEQGATFARVTDLILHDLDLSSEQWALVPEVVPRRFRELTA
jgi:P27 family predicted phage terminase small subunit